MRISQSCLRVNPPLRRTTNTTNQTGATPGTHVTDLPRRPTLCPHKSYSLERPYPSTRKRVLDGRQQALARIRGYGKCGPSWVLYSLQAKPTRRPKFKFKVLIDIIPPVVLVHSRLNEPRKPRRPQNLPAPEILALRAQGGLWYSLTHPVGRLPFNHRLEHTLLITTNRQCCTVTSLGRKSISITIVLYPKKLKRGQPLSALLDSTRLLHTNLLISRSARLDLKLRVPEEHRVISIADGSLLGQKRAQR